MKTPVPPVPTAVKSTCVLLHNIGAADAVTATCVGCVIVIVDDTEQLLPSLHVTVYVPAGLLVNTFDDWKFTPSNE